MSLCKQEHRCPVCGHRLLRSAMSSLDFYLPYHFTYQAEDCAGMPNTNISMKKRPTIKVGLFFMTVARPALFRAELHLYRAPLRLAPYGKENDSIESQAKFHPAI